VKAFLIHFVLVDFGVLNYIYSNRKKRKVLKEKRKLREKINMKMENPNDIHDLQGDNEIFSLNKIKTKKVSLEKQICQNEIKIYKLNIQKENP